MAKRIEDLTNKKFFRLFVLEKATNSKDNRQRYFCLCDCGKKTIIQARNLINGQSKSCGCLKSEINKKKQTKHGKINEKLYAVYQSMKQRCCNEKDRAYKNYGGRGIKVCEEWLDKENGFIDFYNWAIENGYKKGLTIDRINNDGNYEPNNCRWATFKEQSNNRRSNIHIVKNGKKICLTQLAEQEGLKPYVVLYRYKNCKINLLLEKRHLKKIGGNK